MYDGIYEVSFSTSPGKKFDVGDGIVVIKDGAINGGDLAYTYSGQLDITESRATGRIHVAKWSTATTNVFGIDEYDLDFQADISHEGLNGYGTVVGHPDLTLHAFAHRIGNTT